ncbi:hypothetical protein SBV1_370056 [Verrucomicrobia bacterium]|nr:hypothetical protein SBV1_370056 [Verrucomicrobiota bacterium]
MQLPSWLLGVAQPNPQTAGVQAITFTRAAGGACEYAKRTLRPGCSHALMRLNAKTEG